MTKITRKLLLSIITVVLTVVALGTTTFAWFTLTNVAVIQPFEAEIITDSGIEIALGTADSGVANLGLNWVTNLTTVAIENYIATANPGGFQFNHVTTADAQTFRTLGLGAVGATVTGGFIDLPIHFRSNTAIAINWTGVSLTSTPFPWNVDTSFDAITYNSVSSAYEGSPVTSGDVLTIDPADAFRIAIIGNLTATPGNVSTYERPATTTAPFNHILGAVTDYSGTLISGTAGQPDAIYSGTFGSHNYYYEDSNSSPFGIEAISVLPTVQAVSAIRVLDMITGVTNAGAARYGTVNVRIWLEGWDLNAYNSILGATIRTSFQFTGVTV